VKVAIIGTGWGIRVQIPAFRRAGLEITALWARNETKAHEMASKCGIPFATSDYSKIVQRQDVDLICVVTPPSYHLEMATQALQNGKHVLSEKPTAVHTFQAESLLAVSKKFPKQLSMLDHELRFLPSMKKMKNCIAEGKIGEIYSINAIVLSGSRLHTKNYNWWSKKEEGGGVLGAVASHFIDAMTWLTQKKIESVCGTLRTCIPQREDTDGKMQNVSSEDSALAMLQFAGGIPGSMQCSFVHAGKSVHSIEIFGSKGSLKINGGKLIWSPPSSSANNVIEELLVNDDEKLDNEINTMFAYGTVLIGEAIKEYLDEGNSTALDQVATFEDGLYIQKVLDAIRVSNEERRWINI